jgi:hypothetical protein
MPEAAHEPGREETPARRLERIGRDWFFLEQLGMELTPARSAMRIPRATGAVVAASAVGGALVLLLAGWRQSASGPTDAGQWAVAAVIGVLALGSWIRPVVVYRGAESEAFSIDEGVFVILALLVPPLLMLGTLALATVVAQAARRRPVVKSAFNAGQVLIAAGLGLAVSRGIAAPARSLTAGQVAAVALGVGVYIAVNSVLVGGVMVSMGATWREFTVDLPLQLTLAGAGALAGAVLALAIQAHLWALALAIPGLSIQHRLISARYPAAAQGQLARLSVNSLTDLAALLAGSRRPALRAEWRAHLVGQSGHDPVTWRKLRQALGFVASAIQLRLADAADLAWRPADAVLGSRTLSNLFVWGPVIVILVAIVRHDGRFGLVADIQDPAALSAFLYGVVRAGRWWRGVKPPEPKARRARE